jgi:hypothetical protein
VRRGLPNGAALLTRAPTVVPVWTVSNKLFAYINPHDLATFRILSIP